MSWLEFLAAVLPALAWPLTAIAVVLILRRKINDLLGRGLTRLKAGPVEAEWATLSSEARAGLEAELDSDPAVSDGEESSEFSLPRLRKIAELSPELAVIGGFQLLEGLVHDLSPQPSGNRRRVSTMRENLSTLSSLGVLSPLAASALDNLRQLKNVAAHGKDFPDRKVTKADALDYLSLVEEAQEVLIQARRLQERQQTA